MNRFWCVVVVLSAGCALRDVEYPSGATEPLFNYLGEHSVAVTTDSALAQRYFDQGRMMRYSFAFQAAQRAFDQAAELDPGCAKAWWGVAWSRGPHFWSPTVSEENAHLAWQAIDRARASAERASPRERALVEAVAQWFSPDLTVDRATLDRAYASAMAELWAEYPQDSDIGTIYAQSLIALRFRALWRYDAHLQPETQQLVAVLQQVSRSIHGTRAPTTT